MLFWEKSLFVFFLEMLLFMLWIHLSRGLRTKPLLWSCLTWLLRSWRVPEKWSSSYPCSISYCCTVIAVQLLYCWISPWFVSYCLLSVSLILSVISANHYGYLQGRLQNAMVVQIKNWILILILTDWIWFFDLCWSQNRIFTVFHGPWNTKFTNWLSFILVSFPGILHQCYWDLT